MIIKNNDLLVTDVYSLVADAILLILEIISVSEQEVGSPIIPQMEPLKRASLKHK